MVAGTVATVKIRLLWNKVCNYCPCLARAKTVSPAIAERLDPARIDSRALAAKAGASNASAVTNKPIVKPTPASRAAP